jgi:CHAD domain-containing protein
MKIHSTATKGDNDGQVLTKSKSKKKSFVQELLEDEEMQSFIKSRDEWLKEHEDLIKSKTTEQLIREIWG